MRELHMPDLAKPEGYKLILILIEKKGYKKDALVKRLLANRWYEAISRRPGETLQDFFATENMAYAHTPLVRVSAVSGATLSRQTQTQKSSNKIVRHQQETN